MLTPISTPNQIRSMPIFCRDRRQQRNDDERDLEEVEEEREEEDEDIDEDQEADDAAGQMRQHVLDPQVAVDAVEHQAEDGRADQDEHHHRGECAWSSMPCYEQVPGQPAMQRCQRERTDRAHGAGFGRGRKAHEDRAEHQEDQHERRHHARACSARSARRRCSVRTSLGSAGTFSGRMMLTKRIIGAEQRDLDEARAERAGVHVADRLAELVGQHDQHE